MTKMLNLEVWGSQHKLPNHDKPVNFSRKFEYDIQIINFESLMMYINY